VSAGNKDDCGGQIMTGKYLETLVCTYLLRGVDTTEKADETFANAIKLID
jgi:hypothetical protein